MEIQGIVAVPLVKSIPIVPDVLLYIIQAIAPASCANWHFSVNAVTPLCTIAILPSTSASS